MGSGNLGATNTFRNLGWKAALPVIVVDVFKGWFPVWFFPQQDHSAIWEWTLAYAAAAILGHVFSFWVGFKGGKGIATSAGAFLALSPWGVLIALVVMGGCGLLLLGWCPWGLLLRQQPFPSPSSSSPTREGTPWSSSRWPWPLLYSGPTDPTSAGF